jgi:hypothetical protein
MLTLSQEVPTAAAFLSATGAGPVDVPPHLHGFGGLHGGLTLARLTAVMAARAMPGTVLRATGAHYHRPVRGRFSVSSSVRRAGSATMHLSADAIGETGEVLVSATCVVGAPRRAGPLVAAPTPPPGSRRPDAWDVFEIPAELVPVAAATEIRPVGANLPFGGGDRPELTAWVRMVDDDAPPDLVRLIFLLDALAPSYAAVLSEPRDVPTIELSVRPRPDARPTSPWVLLHASTLTAVDGWVDEHIEAWDIDGAHLGSARQLRVTR